MTTRRSALRRTHDSVVAYHLLVATIFTSCLPLTLARAVGGRGQAASFGGALDTARAAAAQAMSITG